MDLKVSWSLCPGAADDDVVEALFLFISFLCLASVALTQAFDLFDAFAS